MVIFANNAIKLPFKRVLASLFLTSCLGLAFAQTALFEALPFSLDVSVSGLEPWTAASGSPTLSAWGLAADAGLEYTTPIHIPFRLEMGYFSTTDSSIASDGELYRGWSGARFAVLTGYTFDPIPVGDLLRLKISALAGGALTAAVYNQTPLAYAYPSILAEPRVLFVIRGIPGWDMGPFLCFPIEAQFRSGCFSLVPGLSLGFSYQLGLPK